jgi:hypothetical protein
MPSLISSRQTAGHPTLRATACASVVLPAPGGPLITTSVGRRVIRIPIADYTATCAATLWRQTVLEVDLSATETELTRLADLVTAGQGSLTCGPEPAEPNTLTAVEVTQTTNPGVRIHVDAARRVLVISGDPATRAILAAKLNGMAQMEDGGHLHVDYFPDHPYLAAGSAPLVVNSPHGGMPTR